MMINNIKEESLQDKCTSLSYKINKLQSENPVWSIVFCAYNEESFLLPTIKSIAEINTILPIEIVAVNNASTDRTREILDQCWIKVIDEKKKWLSYARNAWLEASKWAIIFQTDADTKLPPTWIDAHLKHYGDEELWWVSWKIEYQDVCTLFYLYRAWAIWYHTLLKLIWKGPKCSWWANLSFRKEKAVSVWWYSKWCDDGEDILLFHSLSAISRTKTDASEKINVITNWRRFEKSSQVIAHMKKKICAMKERIFSGDVVPLNQNFEDVR
jgi:glycosyltransferase involved in cell wall biosynthesis